jgi:hypothetical protein
LRPAALEFEISPITPSGGRTTGVLRFSAGRKMTRNETAPDGMLTVNLPPRPSMLVESLRSMGYTLETALADVVDNSIAAGAKRVSVRFLWCGGNPWIAILDDGRGMTPSALVEAMRFGSTSPANVREADDLGRFGLGMKTASISQCRLLTVVSRADERLSGCSWDIEHLALHSNESWEIKVHSEQSLKASVLLSPLVDQLLSWGSGTIVCWEAIDGMFPDKESGRSEARFSASMDLARKHLELVFHRFLSPDPGRTAVRIDFNGSALAAFDPFGPKLAARQELTAEDILINGESIRVQPYVLPHHSKVSKSDYDAFGGDEGYLHNQGFYLYRNRRLIVKGTWFRLIKKEVLNKLVRIRVDIPNSLDALWRIDVRKAEADPPETVLRELRKFVQRIAGVGQRVYTKRAARMQSGPLIPVWKRVVVDSRVQYLLNEDHPLLAELLQDRDGARAAQARACLRLVSNAFPSDVFFADAASDVIELAARPDDPQHIEIARQLIRALRSVGLSGDELHRQVLRTEIPAITPATLTSLLSENA